MSSTNRGGQRIANDYYATPAWCVHRLLEACPLPGGRWLEPAAGEGAIVEAVNEVRGDVKWWANEPHQPFVRESHDCYRVTARDFLGMPSDLCDIKRDVIITNPPYALAQDFVEHALSWEPRYVVMLLRLNYLGGSQRGAWLREHTPDVYVLPNRPSFRADGKTDSCDYAWFVWWQGEQRRGSTLTILSDTPADVRRAQRGMR